MLERLLEIVRLSYLITQKTNYFVEARYAAYVNSVVVRCLDKNDALHVFFHNDVVLTDKHLEELDRIQTKLETMLETGELPELLNVPYSSIPMI